MARDQSIVPDNSAAGIARLLRQVFAQPVERLGDVAHLLVGGAANGASPVGIPANCAVPQAPPGVDVDKNIQLAEGMQAMPDVNGGLGFLKELPSAYSMFHSGAPYDYKVIDPKYERFGNFNYGAMLSAMGIPDPISRRAPGWYQEAKGPYDPKMAIGGVIDPMATIPRTRIRLTRVRTTTTIALAGSSRDNNRHFAACGRCQCRKYRDTPDRRHCACRCFLRRQGAAKKSP